MELMGIFCQEHEEQDEEQVRKEKIQEGHLVEFLQKIRANQNVLNHHAIL
jgi:hypothetical protein